MTVAADASLGTYVSPPGAAPVATAAPGAQGPGAQVGVDKAALLILGTSIVGLVALRVIFGKGPGLPGMRVDATEVIKVWLAYETVNIPLKLLAYHWYGHQVSQAYIILS